MKNCLYCGAAHTDDFKHQLPPLVYYGPHGRMSEDDLAAALAELERYKNAEAVIKDLVVMVANAVKGVK